MQVKSPGPTLYEWVRMCIDCNSFTPDLLELQSNYLWLPVFVYGTEQHNYSEDGVLLDGIRLGQGYTVGNQFVMYQTKERQPLVMYKPMTDYSGKIRGELFLVTPDTLLGLDTKMTNGLWFNRRKQGILWHTEEDKDKKDKTWYATEAWIYVAVSARWQQRQEIGDLTRQPSMTSHFGASYYMFTKSDDQKNRTRPDRRAL